MTDIMFYKIIVGVLALVIVIIVLIDGFTCKEVGELKAEIDDLKIKQARLCQEKTHMYVDYLYSQQKLKKCQEKMDKINKITKYQGS